MKKVLWILLVAVLALQAGFVSWQIVRSERILTAGFEHTLRIGGYDPQDLLRGRYLEFRLRDINQAVFPDWVQENITPYGRLWVWLQPSGFDYDTIIDYSFDERSGQGWLELSFDEDGVLIPPVSRFYLNEKDAPVAERLLAESDDVRIKISLREGRLVVRNLLIDGRSLKAALADER